jgi:hypothetical protein
MLEVRRTDFLEDTMFDATEIPELFSAAGLAIPSDEAAFPIAQKIANDSLVQKRALELAMNAFIVAAVRTMTEGERQVLRKRIGAAPGTPAPAPASKIGFSIYRPMLGQGPIGIRLQ